MRPDCGRKSCAGSSAHSRASMAWPENRIFDCGRGEALAARDAQLPFDQIDPGDRLGHRVLDLQPRVHLHEIEMRRRHRAGIRSCRRPRSSPPAPARPRRCPSARARRRRPQARGFPRSASGAGAAPSSRARRDACTLPCWSANTCTSMCRALSSARSSSSRRRRRRAAPPSAPRRAQRRARSRRRTSRMPRPPPPAAALIISGKPIALPARDQRGVVLLVRARRPEWSARRPRARCASPRPCRPSGGSRPAAGRPR